jgi:hypothetical protein
MTDLTESYAIAAITNSDALVMHNTKSAAATQLFTDRAALQCTR